MAEKITLKPRYASPVQTIAGAYLMHERFGVATPVSGDGNAILRAYPDLLARMEGAEND
jgi:hypothetical protein